ncbi:MAG TPA: potassium channel family protein [Acidimicrobiia bacterium]|nr:potassium channel family protein [Acidimicrobiia bacterium]
MNDSQSLISDRSIRFPDKERHPFRTVVYRFAGAIALLALIAAVVYMGRDGYRDSADGAVSLLDAVYYATVSGTTTGYGDIVPVSDVARRVTIWIVTPLRVAFLVLVVSTTVEVLAASTRYLFRVTRWRKSVKDHYVICGYGTKGRSAAASLASRNVSGDRVVVVELDAVAADEANREGYTVVIGNCTREAVLRRAEVEKAKGVVVAVDRDDTAVLATLTIRSLNPRAQLVVAAREEENTKILRRGGASMVITSDEATGRLLGLALDNPHQAALIEDLLLIGEGIDLVERETTPDQVGRRPPEGTVAVIRQGRILDRQEEIRQGDRLLSIENGDE